MPLTADQLAEYLAFAEQLADASANAIRPYFRSQLNVTDKGHKCSTPSPPLTARASMPCAN